MTLCCRKPGLAPTNNRSVTEDLEAVTKRLRSAEEAHGKEVDEHQRRSNDLQERLVETRAEKAEVSAENLWYVGILLASLLAVEQTEQGGTPLVIIR